MTPAYLGSLPYRRRRFAHAARYRTTYAVGIRLATLVAGRGPVELAVRLAARWSSRAAIVWRHRDGRGWIDDVGDELDDLATAVTLTLDARLTTRVRVAERDLARLDRIAATR